jgi:hypothetical protein
VLIANDKVATGASADATRDSRRSEWLGEAHGGRQAQVRHRVDHADVRGMRRDGGKRSEISLFARSDPGPVGPKKLWADTEVVLPHRYG